MSKPTCFTMLFAPHPRNQEGESVPLTKGAWVVMDCFSTRLHRHGHLGARLRGCTATQSSTKGSEKALGAVLGKGSEKGSDKGACYAAVTVKKGF